MRQWSIRLMLTAFIGFGLTTIARSDTPPADPPRTLRTPYVLDNEQWARDMAAAKTNLERNTILDKRWESVQLAVAHSGVMLDQAFFTSLQYWRSGGQWPKDVVRLDGTLKQRIVLTAENERTPDESDKIPETDPNAIPAELAKPKSPTLTIIPGDCLADVELSPGAKIHLYGDLGGKLRVPGMCEIIIGGSVKESAVIETTGIASVFIGGDVVGSISSSGSLKLWVHGDLRGELTTGVPMSKVHVMGDLVGQIQPRTKQRIQFVSSAGMLNLEVRGYAPSASLEAIGNSYTMFQATISESDCEPGSYPLQAPNQIAGLPGRRPVLTTGHWVTHRYVERSE